MNTPAEQWTEAIIRAGYTDPRYKEDRPSFSRLAEAAGLHTTTVSRLVNGVGTPKPGVVEAVAKALRVDVRFVAEWAHQVRTESKPYEPPAEVNLLTRREQDAITELIRSIAAREARADDPSTTSTETEPDDDMEAEPDKEPNNARTRPTKTVTRSRRYQAPARSTSPGRRPDGQETDSS